MDRSRSLTLIGIILFTSWAAHGETVQCRLIESHVRLSPFHASSNLEVGQFLFISGDSPITKVFPHDESGLDVTVGVEVLKGTFKDQPTRIRVAILPGSKTDDVFAAAIDSSEASSLFDSHWRFLSVNRTIAKNDIWYTFTFSCGRTLKKR